MFRGEDFDFVLLDVKLPGINGVETFLEMRKIRPGAKVMMMTGYSVEQLVAQAIEGGALGVLHKPFAAMQVLELLSQDQAARRGAGGRRRCRVSSAASCRSSKSPVTTSRSRRPAPRRSTRCSAAMSIAWSARFAAAGAVRAPSSMLA